MENNHVFVDRVGELDFLEERYRQDKAELILIYGRRRVGKTCLAVQFIKNKPSVYYLCSEESETEQLRQLSRSVGEYFRDKALVINPFTRWADIIEYLREKTKIRRFILVIDEFPYLINANKATPSILQKYWDLHLNKSKMYLILCGSSIGMMEKAGVTYKSPLYGRRTGLWKLQELRFRHVAKFFDTDIRKAIEFYSITGGIPFYLTELNRKTDILENAKEMTRKGGVFYDEGELLIKSELSDSHTYLSILRAIVDGKTRQNEIAGRAGLKNTSLPKYLNALERLGFVRREISVTEKPRSKKTRYRVNDNFVHYWFKYIEPAKKYVEEGEHGKIDELFKDFNLYVSEKFEELVRKELLAEVNRESGIFDFEKTGRWWGYYRDGKTGERKEMEIDAVALNERTREILFCECKWRSDVDAGKITEKLIEKAGHVEWHNNDRREYFAVFAKSFGKKIQAIEGRPVYCIDLKELEKIFRK